MLAVALVHVYWACGGTSGKGAAVPERGGRPLFRPGVAATSLVAAGLVVGAASTAMEAGLLPATVGRVPHFVTRGLVVVFAARAIGDFRYVGFFKRVRGTRFARLDTVAYTPLCCLLAICVADAARYRSR